MINDGLFSTSCSPCVCERVIEWCMSGWCGLSGVGGQGEEWPDHRKSTLARGSRWDYTPLPF